MSKQKQARSAFVGGYVTPQQKAKLQALAALAGKSVNRALCDLIDNAADVAVGSISQPMHNGAGEVSDANPSAVAA